MYNDSLLYSHVLKVIILGNIENRTEGFIYKLQYIYNSARFHILMSTYLIDQPSWVIYTRLSKLCYVLKTPIFFTQLVRVILRHQHATQLINLIIEFPETHFYFNFNERDLLLRFPGHESNFNIFIFFKNKLILIITILNKKNLWLTAPKGATPVNQTSATDWQMAVRRDNVISITLRQV